MKKLLFLILVIILLFEICSLQVNAVDKHQITILHTNDSHSSLRPKMLKNNVNNDNEYQSGGIVKIAELVKEQREKREKRGEDVFLVSAGDFFGGDPYAWLALAGETPEINLMNQSGYDVVTLGNHEFDFGVDNLASYFSNAGFPDLDQELNIVATNTEIPSESPLRDMGIKKRLIKETKTGLKVGFMGLMGDNAVSLAYDTGKLNFSDVEKAALKAIDYFEKEDVDLVVALTHSGLNEDKKLAKNVDGIDVIVGGHSHHMLEKPVEINDTVIVQAGDNFRALGILELSYDEEKNRVELRNKKTGEPYLVNTDSISKGDQKIEKELKDYDRKLDNYLEELTAGKFKEMSDSALSLDFSLTRSPDMSDTQMGNFITDAMRLAVEDLTKEPVDFAFQANGLIRSDLRGKDDDQVSFYQLASAAGLGIGPDNRPGYPLVEMYLTGDEVENVLEISILLNELQGSIYFLQNSGLRFYYDRRRALFFDVPVLQKPFPTGRSVLGVERYTGSDIQKNDSKSYETLNEDKLYRVVSDYYLLQFLPYVGEVVPSLEINIKDSKGQPIKNNRETIIKLDGEELKVWQAVFHYANMQDNKVNEAYKQAGNRIIPENRFSLLAYSEFFLILFIIFLLFLVYILLKKLIY